MKTTLVTKPNVIVALTLLTVAAVLALIIWRIEGERRAGHALRYEARLEELSKAVAEEMRAQQKTKPRTQPAAANNYDYGPFGLGPGVTAFSLHSEPDPNTAALERIAKAQENIAAAIEEHTWRMELNAQQPQEMRMHVVPDYRLSAGLDRIARAQRATADAIEWQTLQLRQQRVWQILR